MSKFHVIESEGRFFVKSDTESYELSSRQSAEDCCKQLNYEPGRNPCDTFMQGRWTQKQERSQAA